MAELNQITQVRHAHKAPKTMRGMPHIGNVNIPLALIVVLLAGYGLLICWSATVNNADYSFTRQLLCVAIGAIIMVALWHFDYRILSNLTYVFLAINVVLILLPHVPGLGTDAGMGAQSWIRVGIQVQPGEFAKVTVILFAASLLARYGGTLDDAREYLKCVGLMLIPFVLIMTQPDLGTGLVYLVISAVALIVGGARPKFLLLTLLAGVVLVVLLLFVDEMLRYEVRPGEYEYRIFKQYQRSRLLVFLDPESDLSGDGYNLAQAKIAIGSGGLFGKGLLNGTQSAYHLPEAPTDFVFCILAEELGFVGSMALIMLYVALILVCFAIARRAGDLFGMIIVMAIVGMWLFQILENIGMTLGLMPITGIPLPFVSYGSSFMIVNFILLGLVGSVWAHSQPKGMKV